MKRIIFIFATTMLGSAVCSAAMSNSRVRKETRFLTDKMAYELNLSTEQYNDVYEINYDFIVGVRHLMDNVLWGEEWALERYYDYLDVRNGDLRWVLDNRQYVRFMQTAYFYRPVYINNGRWAFRVYVAYTNRDHFYFPRPYHYRTYGGGHYRTRYGSSYYRERYRHPYYTGSWSIRNSGSYHIDRRSDFGAVNVRSGSNKRPVHRDGVYTTRRSGNKGVNGNVRRDYGNDRSMDMRRGSRRNTEMRRDNSDNGNVNARRYKGDERSFGNRRNSGNEREGNVRRIDKGDNRRESMGNGSVHSRRRSVQTTNTENSDRRSAGRSR